MSMYKARVRQNKKIYVHNDLAQGAHYFRQRIEARVKSDDRDGLAYDRLACLILLAFEMEAKANFLVSSLLSRKKQLKLEYRPLRLKLKHVAARLGCTANFGGRPYQTILELVNLRNTLAHGKPEMVVADKEVEGTEEEILKNGALEASWEQYLNDEFIRRCADDVDAIWKTLFEKSKLSIIDTFTHGGAEITFLPADQIHPGPSPD